ncbi:hypothetical protein [Helicobacter sp. 11S03491-1]|uniref:hypothetical protein n=1 Tax=Helicobacter sp. 11S03491-1 TaxID=1476196 RepID=UPI000BA5A90B|nr:hypothetical protein [Helicobacter sp. 11S03491-1]PAF41047.1 hypothetical protein BKH45_08545 [Helicobacter sp. 11S03491-1]
MDLAGKNTNEMSELDRILEAAERVNPRLQLLKEGHNAIYYDGNIINKTIMLRPDGKCFVIKANQELKKNEIIRELTPEEYSKIDLVKGRDY